jgi:hypothetical protein
VFESSKRSDGMTRVTVISCGPNGVREFAGNVDDEAGARGDDLVGFVYLDPPTRNVGNASGKNSARGRKGK